MANALATSASARDAAPPVPEKWRPQDGVYAAPGKDFNRECGEHGDLVLELGRKKVGGMEWSCKVAKTTSTGANSLRVDLICEDADTEEDVDSSPDPKERIQKKVV